MGASLKWNIFNVIVFALNMSSCFAKESQAMCLMVQILPDSQQFSARSQSVRFSLVIIITGMLLLEHVIACGWFGLGSHGISQWQDLADRIRATRCASAQWFDHMEVSHGSVMISPKIGRKREERYWMHQNGKDDYCIYVWYVFSVLGFFLGYLFSCLLCFSGPCFSAFCSLLLCLFASSPRFLLFLLLCFSLLSLCFSAFPASLLLCFSASLLFCCSALLSLLFCFLSLNNPS